MDNYDNRIRKPESGKSLMLNLGCGNNYHPDWVNVDFLSVGREVITYDLTKGIPFSSNMFDVVYHSHVLEHFTALQGQFFIQECYRVLKPQGIIRIAVPDLESIARNYIQYLEQALNEEKEAYEKYEWMKLELYDQTTRNSSSGAYPSFLKHADAETREFARKRLGKEIDSILKTEVLSLFQRLWQKTFREYFALLRKNILKAFIFVWGGKRMVNAFEIGMFRISGEIHQCMYDRYSLGRLLKSQNFEEINEMTAFHSSIKGFGNYRLDANDEDIRKPDSLFLEARKK